MGEALLKASLNIAYQQGVKKSMLWVEVSNASAIRLYEKLGYKIDKSECEATFVYE